MLVQLAAHIFVLVARKLFLIHYSLLYNFVVDNFKVFNNNKKTLYYYSLVNTVVCLR